jgi:hypothetical protein
MMPAIKPLTMPVLLNIPQFGATAQHGHEARPMDVKSSLYIFGGTTEIQKEIIARSLGL